MLAHIFGNIKLRPAYKRLLEWKNSVVEDGVAMGQGLGIACSNDIEADGYAQDAGEAISLVKRLMKS